MMSWRSLRFRIAAVIVVLILILGLGGTVRARADLARIGRAELEKRGISIARDLAVQHADQILVNDVYTLYTLVNGYLINNPDLRYIFIMDAQGQVLVSNFPQGLPPGLRQANVPARDEKYRIQQLQTTDGTVQDVAMFVTEEEAGIVRVGLLDAPLWVQVNRQTWGLLALTVGIALLGAGAGFALGAYLTRPFSELVRITQAVARGDLQRKAPVKGDDEVAKLAHAFNQMTDALATSRDELLRRNEELLALNAIAVAVGHSLHMETILDAALSKVLELMDFSAGWVFLQEQGDGCLVLAARQGVPADLFRLDVGATEELCTCQQALRTGSVQLVEKIEGCPRLNRLDPEEGCGVCHASVPLRSGDRILGLMNLVCADNWYPSSEEDLGLLTAIGHQIGVAVENARLYHELQHKEALRGQLLRKLIFAQEEERRRIARELHDQYAQVLTALSISVEAAERVLPAEMTAVRRQLEEVKHLAAQTLDQTYELIFDLRPTTLDDLGLVPAIRWYAESRLEPLGVKVHLETRNVRERLSAEGKIALYRVVQEAILNVAKHARAHELWIRLEVSNSRLHGVIEDDGQGFDLAEIQRNESDGRGMGLLGMQERMQLLGGTLHIETTLGQGTQVCMDLPIDPLPAEGLKEAGGDV